MEHIPFYLLTDYACDRIDEQQIREAVMTHVDSCADCRQALAIAWQVARRAHAAVPDQPSASLVQRVLKATRNYATHHSPTMIPATLLHDSKLDAATQGIRGALQERELLFAFGSFDLHLSIMHSEATESYMLLGQIMTGETNPSTNPSDVEGSRVELCQDDAITRVVLADEVGRFRISRLPQGTYSLCVTIGETKTVVDALPAFESNLY